MVPNKVSLRTREPKGSSLGDPWWSLVTPFTNDVNEKNEKWCKWKRDTLTQKRGVMSFPKNWIGILRPAINEWRPKNYFFREIKIQHLISRNFLPMRLHIIHRSFRNSNHIFGSTSGWTICCRNNGQRRLSDKYTICSWCNNLLRIINQWQSISK